MSVSGKVVLITGGASGIGKACVEEFLRNDVKGVVVADTNSDLGEEVTQDFNEKFGPSKVIFVKTDISNRDSFENAFQKAIQQYNNIDILINAAGIFDEVNWERLLNVNVVGTTHGCLLAINKYFPKYKSNSEAYIINLASLAALLPVEFAPHYTSSKYAIIGLTRSLGINRTIAKQGVCVMAICPGATDTSMFRKPSPETVIFSESLTEFIAKLKCQKAEVVATSIINILSKADSGSSWIINEGVLSKLKYPTLEEMINPTS